VQRRIIKGIWMLFASLIVLVLCWLAFYNCPQSDDFLYAMWMRDWGLADANLTIYYAWGGRYFSNLLLTLCNSLAYSDNYQEFLWLYQTHSLIHLLFLFLALYIFFKRIQFDGMSIWLFAIPILFFLQKAASLSEFLYWLAAASTYCSGTIFAILSIAATLDFQRQSDRVHSGEMKNVVVGGLFITIVVTVLAWLFRKELIHFLNENPFPFLALLSLAIGISFWFMWRPNDKNAWKSFIALSFFLFAGAGCSELVGAIQVVSMGLLWLWFFTKNRKLAMLRFLPILIALAALALNVMAPATANRQETVSNALTHNLLHSVSGALRMLMMTVEFIPAAVAGFFLSLIIGQKASDKKPFSFKPVLFFLLFILTINFILPLLTLYKAGEIPARVKNIHQFAACLSLFVFFLFAGLKSVQLKEEAKKGFIVACNLLIPFWLLLPIGKNNFLSALEDLSSGRAKGFYQTFCEEQEQIKACKEEICEVNPLYFKPLCISSGSNAVEEGKDPPSWVAYKNHSYAAYYGKKRIFRLVRKNP
jgi:hypothetical protein